MTEIALLNFFLCIGFILAPLMTNRFFLNGSRAYSDAHKISLIILLTAAIFHLNYLSVVWPLFCLFGFCLYLKRECNLKFSVKSLVGYIPFIFSLIASIWFVAGVNDLHFLGYDRAWSFYAALHANFLGWMLIACFSFLSRLMVSSKCYLWGCYLCFTFFLLVAFGINGIPYIKHIGAIGLSLIVPFLIGLYAFNVKTKRSFILTMLSLVSITLSMILAILNEFWAAAPKIAFGIPIMVLVHGLINAVLAVPCFFAAIRLECNERSRKSNAGENVVFFDDVCALCCSSVQLLLKIDNNRSFKYSSLQGKYARHVLDSHSIESGASVMLYSDGALYQKAEAVLFILMKLAGQYRFLGALLKILPLFILNILYDCVARNRHRILGKDRSCIVATDKNKDLFIA